MTFRSFTTGEEFPPSERTVEDAPNGLRHEFVDVIFHISEQNGNPEDKQVYRVTCQSLGYPITANPYGGYRTRCSRDIDRVEWPRVYDLLLRLVPEFEKWGLLSDYVSGVNKILAAHGIVWELDDEGRLQRVLPETARAQVVAAIGELSEEKFAAASKHFADARDAYDDRPRRDRDACANAFDALESVAKERNSMPHDTFGAVMKKVRGDGAFNPQVLNLLDSINTLRNKNFGHGMTTPFGLSGPEVDFTYLSCVAGIILFARTP